MRLKGDEVPCFEVTLIAAQVPLPVRPQGPTNFFVATRLCLPIALSTTNNCFGNYFCNPPPASCPLLPPPLHLGAGLGGDVLHVYFWCDFLCLAYHIGQTSHFKASIPLKVAP